MRGDIHIRCPGALALEVAVFMAVVLTANLRGSVVALEPTPNAPSGNSPSPAPAPYPVDAAALNARLNSAARTNVYGIVGQGRRFVYVFDRSTSMGAGANHVFRHAQKELLASLDALSDEQQFQIIFYNEAQRVFALGNAPGRLVAATETNRSAARQFVLATTADGATDHRSALDVALRFDPDVIYFLTDADEPGLTAGEFDQLLRRNQQAVVHCIEFGSGPKRSSNNFLERLATATRGEYRYLDVTRDLR